MKSFRMQKISGDADVTKETLLWLLVLVLVLPVVIYFGAPLVTMLLDGRV